MKKTDQIIMLIDKTLYRLEARRKLLNGCPSGDVKNKLLTNLLEDQQEMMGHLKRYESLLGKAE